jgi:hypothetical protein
LIAYRELRIMHQLGYANYKLQNDHKFKIGNAALWMPSAVVAMLACWL